MEVIKKMFYPQSIIFSTLLFNIDTSSPEILDLSNKLQGKNELETSKNIFGFINRNITYLAERTDKWQTPTETLDLKKGDCEDITILAMSLFTVANISNFLVIIRGTDWIEFHALNMIRLQDVQEPLLLDMSLKHKFGEALPYLSEDINLYGLYSTNILFSSFGFPIPLATAMSTIGQLPL